jgi:hypothetical protein
MSYDIEIIKQDGSQEECDLNITFNLKKMFNWALSCEYWVDEVEDVLTDGVAVKLLRAIMKMIEYRKDAEEFSDVYDWGTYEHGLQFLTNFYQTCRKYPNCTVHIDK